MTTYTIYKTLHIIGLVIWLGGLFSLSSLIRLQNKEEGAFKERLTAYGRKIYYVSNLIGLVLTLVFGTLLILENTGIFKNGWFHAKLFFVFCLIILDHVILRKLKKIAQMNVSEGSIKWYHSLIAFFFIVITFLAINKPF